MGIRAELVGAGGAVVRLPDPAGGTFDAAGDFDELVPVDATEYPVLSQVEPFDDKSFSPAEMDRLIVEIDRLVVSATSDLQRKGLLRLRALALTCRDSPGSTLRFVGD
ncbi:hypothetical protein GCM10009554_44770 [Kribbella koreensis]|uniref:Uncharacterized protein n=1 Tax=Kribbella koreensis TaxID=57909 RepID=A0ABN1QUS5_9ACTN